MRGFAQTFKVTYAHASQLRLLRRLFPDARTNWPQRVALRSLGIQVRRETIMTKKLRGLARQVRRTQAGRLARWTSTTSIGNG